MAQDPQNQANFKNSAWKYQYVSWQRTADVWSGVRCIRESTVEYLTKFVRESADDYTSRKKATEFYNVFGHTVDSVVGMICTNDIAPAEAPPVITEMFRDIDLAGNDLAAFLRVTTTNAVRDGHSFVLVDGPGPNPTKDDGSRPSTADVADRRAFWINYKASQLVNSQYEIRNGKLILTQATFEEITYEPDGIYGEKKVTRYRVLRPGSYSLYRLSEGEDGAAKGELISEQEDVATGGKEIKLAVMYAKQTAPLESVPPFLDLLETNITHYNSQSVLREALKYIVPMPIFKVPSEADVEKFQKIVVAANRGIIMYGENASAEYLELKGQSIPELRIDIANLETRMAKLGVEKFAPIEDNSTKTATEVGSDNRKEMSEVALIAKNLENCVEQAIYFTAEMENSIKGKGTINLTETEKSKLRLNISYDKLTFDVEQLQIFSNMVKEGNLSKRTFLTVFERQYRKDLPDDWSIDTELAEIKKDALEEPVLSPVEKLLAARNGAGV